MSRNRMLATATAALALSAVMLLPGLPSAAEKATPKAEEGFVSIFDGKTLAGWHASAKTGHSRASKNRPQRSSQERTV